MRRFLGGCLGPSDFRKNASRLAAELSTAPPDLLALLDDRLPGPCDGSTARERLSSEPRAAAHRAVSTRLAAFLRELDGTGKPFNFSDCSIGNLVLPDRS